MWYKSKKILLTLFALVIALAIVFSSACSSRPEQRPAPQSVKQPLAQQKSNLNKSITKDRISSKEQQKMASDAAKAAKRVKGVRSATVVVTGNTAIVGLTLDANLGPQKSAQVKKDVEKAVRKVDKSLKNVSVTADPGLVKRIQKIADGVVSGRPISQFTTELSDILTRITPR